MKKSFFWKFAFAALLIDGTAHGDVKFKKTTLVLGKTKIEAEIADNEEKREHGLMNRVALKDSEGMLFIFDKPEPLSFWMKDTLIPLSIGFFDESGKLFQILEMVPASPMDTKPEVYNSSKPGKYALEEPKGWFEKKKISVGTQLKAPELHLPADASPTP